MLRTALRTGTIVAASLLALGPLAPRAFAGDMGPDGNVRADDEDEDTIKELEKFANDFLVVDEDKKIHVKKEFKENLEDGPLPPDQIERQVQLYLKVGENGKLKIRDVEAIRPFLPQVKAYLPQLRALMTKSPEEQKKELEKLYPGSGEKKEPKKEEPKKEPKGEGRTRPVPAPEPRPELRPEHRPGPGPGADRIEARMNALEERLTRLEGAIEKLTRALDGRTSSGDEKPRYKQEAWGWRAEPGSPAPRARREREESDDRGNGRGNNGRGNGRGNGGDDRRVDDFRKMAERIQKELRDRFGEDLNPDELRKAFDRFQREMRDRFDRGDRGDRDEREGRRDERKRGDKRDKKHNEKDEDDDDDD